MKKRETDEIQTVTMCDNLVETTKGSRDQEEKIYHDA